MHGVARKARSYDGFWICFRAVMSRQSLIAAGPQPHPFDRQELPLAVLEIPVSGREGGPFARAITSPPTLFAAGAQPRRFAGPCLPLALPEITTFCRPEETSGGEK